MSSYADRTYGDSYFADRYPSTVWDNATDANKDKALATATRLIDNLNFAGDKYLSTQDNEFPRGDDTTVPSKIKDACCEIAYALLDGADPELEMQSVGLESVGFAKVSLDKNFTPEHLKHGIVSARAWIYLRPYLRDPNTVTLSRIT